MDSFAHMLLWTFLAGACIPVGAALARIEHIRPRWLEDEFRHFVIAFGGGVLLGAVALVLLPEGSKRLSQPLAAFAVMLAGGGAFMAIDRVQAKRRRETPQLTAIVVSQIVSRPIFRIISVGTVLDSSDCLGFTRKAWGDGVMSLATEASGKEGIGGGGNRPAPACQKGMSSSGKRDNCLSSSEGGGGWRRSW